MVNVRDVSFQQRLFRSPKYYAKRATEIQRQQSLEASVQVHGQEEDDVEKEQEEEELGNITFVGMEDAGKQGPEVEERDAKGVRLDRSSWEDKMNILLDDTAASDVTGEDSSKEPEERPETKDEDRLQDDSVLATIGFDRDFFNALTVFEREDLQESDEQQVSLDKEHSSYV